ncbi:hypothetical protein METBIDRAFT_35559 [Metschnikowia bicuspidata var. bicuspidata NRRL YB-4993]|uniref:Uncharacterized protein n=1 Tax=Metschnikowia bicuspidata var. bicuspidata NRRL YB-4993 TaxID=869754 RepID=A0A1A0HGW9_9ASCO|nr:hypothetical protein METBIDRAFT_35559 [Metschnikowia bicuspidata var. bicuspidata NRRL YB-4993]OBA23127.1 hypothetical protein METBIDRAFT_35559 [Metschnikowia bicuspidata var. bicuspidata NRRL YB-4993]
MDSDAFNSYCITCDQLCSENTVYCSQACKEQDEQQSSSILQSVNADIASPLLTPSLYQQNQYFPLAESIGSPLLLPTSLRSEANMADFSLNYSISQPLSQNKVISSTSQNYRLWLSGM